MATVTVPNVVGLTQEKAEQALGAFNLRFISRRPFDASGDGRASAQNPAAGTKVPEYAIVTVDYPSPLGGAWPDSPVGGPTPQGDLEGTVTGVFVGTKDARIDFTIQGGQSFEFLLYRGGDGTTVPREEWMRRGAMLSLAQRAFTGKDKVMVNVNANGGVEFMKVHR